MERVAGRYLLEGRIARGGMAEVWRAKDERLGRQVALKFLLEGADSERFRREARIAASLGHPNIATIYECGESERGTFIAMELVRGEPFSRFPRAELRLGVRLLRDAALAVDAAHRAGILHRDLKPDNFMISDGPEGPKILVLDFGLARIMGPSSLSVSGDVVGTPAFMAPEQARGRIHQLDPRCDVYSLGATLYWLLTGSGPFRHTDVYEVLRMVVEEDPATPGDCDPDLATIVMKCLRREPKARYESARALADELTRWLEGRSIVARPPSMPYRLWKRARRHAGTLLAVAAVLAAGSGLLAFRNATRAHAARVPDEAVLRATQSRIERYHSRRREPAARIAPAELAQLQRDLLAMPESPRGWWLSGLLHEVSGNLREAEIAYERGLTMDKSYPPLLLRKGAVVLRRSFFLKWMGGANSEWAPKTNLAVSCLKECRDLGAGFDRDLAKAYVDAHALWGTGRFSPEEWIRKWPGREEEFLLIDALSRPPQFDSLDRLLAVAPSWGVAWFWLGTALHVLGSDREAVRAHEFASALQPESAEAHYGLGMARIAEGRFSEAVLDLGRAIQYGGARGVYFCARAHALMALGKPAEAREDYDRALEIWPTNVDAIVGRGRVWLALNNPTRAESAFNQALVLDHECAEAYAGLGQLHAAAGDFTHAEWAFSRALRLRGRWPYVCLARAVARKELGDVEGAVSDWSAAVADMLKK